MIDFATQPPENDLHALHLSDEARQKLCEESVRAFSKAVWTDASRGNILCIRVNDGASLPSAEDRLSILRMSKFRTIESEGDGMKSYIATVISVLLGRRPVIVIDEPEMCLHPPQAYNLGQFIGANATGNEIATFVATHSSQVLRGIVQSGSHMQIVRMTRKQDGFSAKLVSSEVLRDAMKKPTVRGETVLDGIFAQAVAVVEAGSDRIVYQAAWEAVGAERNFDIHFATVGGTGGIADTCKLYRTLGIPVAVISDLDLILDPNRLVSVIESLSGNEQDSDELRKNALQISDAIKALPPTISEEEVLDQLNRLSSGEYRWSSSDDLKLLGDLQSITSQLNRMNRIKSGGVKNLTEPVSLSVRNLIEKCASYGLFLVYVGELEYWLEGKVSASKQKKWAWANEAAQLLSQTPMSDTDIWQFTNSVGTYLERQFGSAALDPYQRVEVGAGLGVGNPNQNGAPEGPA